MKTFKNIFILALFLIFFQSCASMKDGLSRSKKDNTDEFLVEKKNPLKLPPDYEVLPTPNQEELSEKKKSFGLSKKNENTGIIKPIDIISKCPQYYHSHSKNPMSPQTILFHLVLF